jgi:hypothetical protein
MIVKGTEFELPPPGVGLTTVTFTVPAVDTFSAGTTAVNFPVNLPSLSNVVVRGVPFQLIFDP